MYLLPATGYVRLAQILGRAEVTEQQAAQNRRAGKGPRRPRPAIAGLIPVSKSTWWDGVRSGRFPHPVKIGRRAIAWRAEDIYRLIEAVK